MLSDLGALSRDPVAFVQWAFPWGTGGLEGIAGPCDWQLRVLEYIRDELARGYALGPTITGAIKIARASGHGIGKSTLVAWITWWAISTFEDTRGTITANTEKQLTTKTRAEIAKWHRLFIAGHLFKMTATAIFSADPSREMTWRIDLVAWSETNPESFAGLHNRGKRILLIFDEASTISDVIWETAEGALTDPETEIIWAVFGNPTQNTGRFRECFGRFAARWNHEQVDARDVPFNTNRKQHEEWIKDWGEDSDFVRVRVRGVFPRAGSMEFISSEDVQAASTREAECHLRDPLILGVDVARFGDDESVIFFRKGRDAQTWPPIRLRGLDTMSLAGRVADEFLSRHADACFVDGTGVGGGVVDRLRQMHIPVHDIQFGAKPDGFGFLTGDDGVRYANKRAEIWGAMREWLKTGSIPDLPDLRSQLVGPQYAFNQRNEIQLERKEDLKKRGLESPDLADALALTFSAPVAPRPVEGHIGPDRPLVESEYNPFSAERMVA
jgi:hypothetical protein